MKKIVVLLTLFSLIPSIAATSLYQYDSLDIQMDVNGEFTLVADGNAKLQSVDAEILLYPHDDFRQKITELTSVGQIIDNKILFEWNDRQLGKKQFGYTAQVHTTDQRTKVTRKIPYPIPRTKIQNLQKYLEPTAIIDSENPQIIMKASELAEGETDLFKVVFNLAEWVERSVEYDLNTLTATSSQKASWVLQNRQGVCDEMTSLLVAMARSLGIPARFVSGISYTTSELFEEPWQPHGWAEVYFPDVGWVSFDITFGEYGYVDVTHIKLRDSFDPAEPATRYEWRATNVNLETSQLDFDLVIQAYGTPQRPALTLEQEILSPQVSFGSHNLVKGIITNTQNYYAATTLQLAVPQEVTILGRNRRTIMLRPSEVRETFWIVKTDPSLDPLYQYHFPMIMYSEKNISVTESFTTLSGGATYTQQDIEQLTVQDEEKEFSQDISIRCNDPGDVSQGDERDFSCTIHNTGNTNLHNVRFCVGSSCDTIPLPINQEYTNTILLPTREIGHQKVIISATNTQVEKKTAIDYQVQDIPQLMVNVIHPPEAYLKESFDIVIALEKTSFAQPDDITVVLDGPGFQNVWEVSHFGSEETLSITLKNPQLSRTNDYVITTSWNGEYENTQQIKITGKGKTFMDSVKLFFNGIFNVFL